MRGPWIFSFQAGWFNPMYMPMTDGTTRILITVRKIARGSKLIFCKIEDAGSYMCDQKAKFKGVKMMDATVLMELIVMLKAAFPLAKDVRKLDKFPPGQHERRIIPKPIDGDGAKVETIV